MHENASAFGAPPRTPLGGSGRPPDPQSLELRLRPPASGVGHCLRQWLVWSQNLGIFGFQGIFFSSCIPDDIFNELNEQNITLSLSGRNDIKRVGS